MLILFCGCMWFLIYLDLFGLNQSLWFLEILHPTNAYYLHIFVTSKNMSCFSPFQFLFWHLNFCCRIPVIGGRDVDLHRLFVEVTSRGGLAKVSSGYDSHPALSCSAIVVLVHA